MGFHYRVLFGMRYKIPTLPRGRSEKNPNSVAPIIKFVNTSSARVLVHEGQVNALRSSILNNDRF